MSRSERKFYDTGCITEKTQEHRRQILAMDELFMEDGNEQQQLEDEEHQQQLEEDENGN